MEKDMDNCKDPTWEDRHWWTDTGHCADGCPGCLEDKKEADRRFGQPHYGHD